MAGRAWFVVAYDVADPARLRRVHRRLRAEGLAVQKSVFLVRARPRRLRALLDEVEALMDPRRDDLRAYRVTHPARLWLSSACPGVHAEPAPARGARPWRRRALERLRGWAERLRGTPWKEG